MAYDKQKIFEQAKEVIVKHKLFFIDDVVAYLPIAKSTFYEWKMEQSEELKELLETNRVNLKVSMRSKWYMSENATLQMGLMKLLSTPEELRKLSMNTNAHEGSVSTKILNIDPLETDDSTEENSES